ncbi:MAG: hypothetical protein HKN76_20890 [Saprospiraceae bacterium]|nr:hypothetical protein [Saprospiraceae bacterium]
MWDSILEIILSTDDALLQIVAEYGTLTYVILFLIIYAETGLLVFPFLPGDGLLFSIGVIAGLGFLKISWLLPILTLAAYLGNLSSYLLGRYSAGIIAKTHSSRLSAYTGKASAFYMRYGPMAIIIARFFPILRTYIPYVAGITQMNQVKFHRNSLLGAIVWISIFVGSGYFLGEVKWIAENYGLIFLSLIIITVLPLPIRVLLQVGKKWSTKKD